MTRIPAECGTKAGYRRHLRNGEKSCEACLAANRKANSDAHRVNIPAPRPLIRQRGPQKLDKTPLPEPAPIAWEGPLGSYPPFDDAALCRQVDAHLFFADQGEGDLSQAAKRLCLAGEGCPWLEPCLAYAVAVDVDGVWGGTTYKDRVGLRRKGHVRVRPVVRNGGAA